MLNRDENRERCGIVELEPYKLRKVAFCVDVEVAPTHEDIEARKEARRKRKEAKEKAAAEREPEKTAEGKDDEVKIVVEKVDGEVEPPLMNEKADGETVERTASATSTEGKEVKQKKRIHTRPTTDPGRIYMQCCQLRETKQDPQVQEQLQELKGAPLAAVIDLTGLKFQLADCIAFADFLALVPVKCLILEDCDLTDEMVRVVLSALSTVRTPQAAPVRTTSPGKDGKVQPPKFGAHEKCHYERGAVEKVSFKNNPKVGADGWRYISMFIHMSRTLKSIDVSGIALPHPHVQAHSILGRNSPAPNAGLDHAGLLARVLGQRLVGHGLEELVMGNCELSIEQLKVILGGVIQGRTRRLGLGGNSLTDDGLAAIGQWMKSSDNGGDGCCESLDVSGNDIGDNIAIISASLNETTPLCALDLSSCHLTLSSLQSLLPALTTVPNLRWIDFSHNPALFETQPDSLPLLRHYLPQLSGLRKIDLSATGLPPDHAIALAEILPACRQLAFFRLTGNPLPTTDEAAALYTALIAAVKISKTIIRVDLDEPTDPTICDLSKRLLAECMRNMETGPAMNVGDDWSIDAITDVNGPLAHVEDDDAEVRYEYDEDGVWRDEESYVVGGTGVVKALGVCLANNPAPTPLLEQLEDFATEKANEMSLALLTRARSIKQRIQPALQKPYSGQLEEFHHRTSPPTPRHFLHYTNPTGRLLFLDSTLTAIITRFEAEHPAFTLPQPSSTSPVPPSPTTPPASPMLLPTSIHSPTHQLRPISRRNSDVSVHSRYLEREEGQMHKLGSYMQKVVIDGGEDGSGVFNSEGRREALLQGVEEMEGEELRLKVLSREGGVEGYIGRLEEERKRRQGVFDEDEDAESEDADSDGNHAGVATSSAVESEEDIGPMGEAK